MTDPVIYVWVRYDLLRNSVMYVLVRYDLLQEIGDVCLGTL